MGQISRSYLITTPPGGKPVMERVEEQVARMFHLVREEVERAACPTKEKTLAKVMVSAQRRGPFRTGHPEKQVPPDSCES